MPISIETLVRVARADIEMHMAFARTIMLWQTGESPSHRIDGDCNDNVSLLSGGQLNIAGSLNADVEASGHHEIVIAGNVGENTILECSGFSSVFIGGDFGGTVRSTDTAKIWIENNFTGTVKTGIPSTDIRVGGNYNGTIEPLGNPSLLTLAIGGYATNESLMHIADQGYTQFNASVRASNAQPGIYPLQGHRKQTPNGNSFNRWSIESRRDC